jgi:hypothetical protein
LTISLNFLIVDFVQIVTFQQLGMLLFARSQQLKSLGRLSIAPGIFNINEMVTFGMVQGTAAPLGRATHPHSIAKYETIVNTTGTNMNGMHEVNN